MLQRKGKSRDPWELSPAQGSCLGFDLADILEQVQTKASRCADRASRSLERSAINVSEQCPRVAIKEAESERGVGKRSRGKPNMYFVLDV